MDSRRSRLFVTILALTLSAAALQAATTIVATPNTVALTYQLGAGAGAGPGAAVPVKIAPAGTTGSIYWTVNVSTLPAWLVIDKSNGAATSSTAGTVNFAASPVAASLGAGAFTASVGIQSAGLADIAIAVSLAVKNTPAQILASLTTIPTWTPGTAIPTGVKLSLKSVGDPLSFVILSTATNPATAWFTLASATGTAYSAWNTDINVTFMKSAFDNAVYGKALTGTITVKSPNNTVVVPVSVAIGLPPITIASITPAKLPKVPTGAGTRAISVSGAGFVDGMAVKLNGATAAIANNCATFNAATTNAVCIQSPTRFFLKLTEATDLKAGADITLHVEAATFNIPVTTNPIVYSVTNSGSYQQVAGGNQTVSPYEMIGIFGDNFLKAGDAAYGAVANGRYPNTLTDSTNTSLSVHFMKASDGSDLANDTDGYLLFATSSQINLLVPSTLPVAGAGVLEAVVVYGASAASDPVPLDVAAAHPGMFTFVTTGDAIDINADGTINSSANPAKLSASAPTFVTLYVTGMGDPKDGTSDVGAGAGAGPFAGCVAVAKSLATTSWATLDGGIVDATTMVGAATLPPCYDPATVDVSIGGKHFTGAALGYAGWVAGSVAGLNQINVLLPVSPIAGMAPITLSGFNYATTVTIGGKTSPAATVYIK